MVGKHKSNWGRNINETQVEHISETRVIITEVWDTEEQVQPGDAGVRQGVESMCRDSGEVRYKN